MGEEEEVFGEWPCGAATEAVDRGIGAWARSTETRDLGGSHRTAAALHGPRSHSRQG
jgi:hypothetical protein